MPSPWKKIADAPKDGTIIFARGHDWGDRTNKWHHALAFWEDGNWNEVGSQGSQLYYLEEWRPFTNGDGK